MISAFSACCLCYSTTPGGFGISSVGSQEKAIIFRSKLSNFNREPLQEYQQKMRNYHRSKYHQVHSMHSSKDRDISDVRMSKLDEFKHLSRAIYEFSRPYTVLGTIMSITSVSLLPINSWTQLITPYFLVALLKAIIPSLLINVYAVGINQIYDVEIDKVNKPSLPLPSGAFSLDFGVKIVAISLIMALGLGIRFGSPVLLSVLVFSALLGTMYSIELPYMRWKRNPFLAAFVIVFSRSISVQLAYYIHMQKYVLGEPIVLTRGIIFAAAFMFLFASVIAIFKDIPNIDGDKLFNIRTFGVKFGQDRMFWFCVGTLMMAYGGGMAIGIYSSSLFNKIVAVLGHFSLAFILINKALKINEINKESMEAFYMLIWKLFYAEYLLIPFMR